MKRLLVVLSSSVLLMSPSSYFTPGTYWNSSTPSTAPIDPNSDNFVNWLCNNDNGCYVKLPAATNGVGHPVYTADHSMAGVALHVNNALAPDVIYPPVNMAPSSTSDKTLAL